MQDDDAVQGVRFAYSPRRTWLGAVILVALSLGWLHLIMHLDEVVRRDPSSFGRTEWFQEMLINASPGERLAIMIACELFLLWMLAIQLQGFRRRSMLVYDGSTYFGTTYNGFRASVAADEVKAFTLGQSYVTVIGGSRRIYIRQQTLDMRPSQVDELCRLLGRTITTNRMYGRAGGPEPK